VEEPCLSGVTLLAFLSLQANAPLAACPAPSSSRTFPSAPSPGLLEFLAAEPYHHSPVWRGLLQHEYEAQRPGGLLALRALLRGVMLRRSKADVGGWAGGSGAIELR
jgi:hypothetical protein